MVALLRNLVCGADGTWLAGECELIGWLCDGLAWQGSWWLGNFESFVETCGCVKGALSDWLAQDTLGGGGAGGWCEILECDAAQKTESCLAGLHCGGRYIIKER